MTPSPRGKPDLAPGPGRELVGLFRRLRARHHLSLGQLSARTELSTGHLSDVLNGWKAPSPDSAARIAEALGADQAMALRARRLAEALHELNRYNRARVRRRRHRPASAEPLLEQAAPADDPVTPQAVAMASLPVAVIPPPAQLPPTLPYFVNRTSELGTLHDTFRKSRPDGRIFAISGLAGTGTSALAIRFSYEVLSEFPDAQLYVDLRGDDDDPADPAEVLDRFLRALAVPAAHLPPAIEERQALYRSLLSKRHALVVLDNASDERQVRPLLPGGPDCLVVATSRRPLGGLDLAEQILLDPLAPRHALELLALLAGHDRIAAEQEAANLVALYCDYLPLALRIAGARLRSRPGWRVADLVSRLRDERQRLHELRAGDWSVRSSILLSYRDLTPGLARAFCLLGQAPGLDFGLPGAAAAIGCDVRDAERLLEELVDVALLETPAAGTYRFHDLLRVFAREQAAGHAESERRRALERILMPHRDSGRPGRQPIG